MNSRLTADPFMRDALAALAALRDCCATLRGGRAPQRARREVAAALRALARTSGDGSLLALVRDGRLSATLACGSAGR
ncbi:MAG: hypothetical protein LW847_02530 [Burkholderiales bacterium]|jgi:hypothetical protein|nr:hypothetical protein [Burkholderiales bacterium]